MNSVEQNLEKWNVAHDWAEDGDEWKGQAVKCGVPYPAWKASLVSNLIDQLVPPGSRILEIGSGHGRWSSYLAAGPSNCFWSILVLTTSKVARRASSICRTFNID